jgi:hypothetical protein
MIKQVKQNKRVPSGLDINNTQVQDSYRQPETRVSAPKTPPVIRASNPEVETMEEGDVVAGEETETSPVASLLMDMSQQEKEEMFNLLKAEFEVATEEVDIEGEESEEEI